MDAERNLFELMQDFMPPEELLCDDCEKADVERCKLRVFRKKGAGFMRRKVLKRLAVAALALTIMTCGAAGVDAATGGHIHKKIIPLKGTVIKDNKDGSMMVHVGDKIIECTDGTKFRIDVNNPDGTEIKENKDGSISVDCDGEAADDNEISIKINEVKD